MGEFKKYNLTRGQLIQLSRLCVQEQGAKGAPFEASLMCNLYELYGSKYRSLYDYVRNSGWFYKAPYYMDNGSASDAVIDEVTKVINGGVRRFPRYIDEHDCLRDIEWVKNGGSSIEKTARDLYKPNYTVIHNKMGSTYTFYSFPVISSDPFGYTDNKYAPKKNTDRVLMCIGNDVNFRNGAGTNYDSLCKLDAGELLTELGTSGAWTKAKYHDMVGYICTRYICDIEQVANEILGKLSSTYSTPEIRVILLAMEKLVN